MCELCVSEEWHEEVPAGPAEEDPACEFQDDDNDAVCGAPAEYEYRERFVDDHLCEGHAREYAESLGLTVTDLLQPGSGAPGETLKPLVARMECDLCTEPARYANIAMASTFFCAMHRGAFGE